MIRSLVSKKILIVGAVLIMGLSILVLSMILGGGKPTMEAIEKLSDKDIPSKVLVWLDTEKFTEGYGAFYFEGHVYLAAKMGERPTGGYAVSLGEAKYKDDQVKVQVEFKKPKPWDIVTQVITYPRTVVKIACPTEPPGYVLFVTNSNSVIARVSVRNLDIE